MAVLATGVLTSLISGDVGAVVWFCLPAVVLLAAEALGTNRVDSVWRWLARSVTVPLGAVLATAALLSPFVALDRALGLPGTRGRPGPVVPPARAVGSGVDRRSRRHRSSGRRQLVDDGPARGNCGVDGDGRDGRRTDVDVRRRRPDWMDRDQPGDTVGVVGPHHGRAGGLGARRRRSSTMVCRCSGWWPWSSPGRSPLRVVRSSIARTKGSGRSSAAGCAAFGTSVVLGSVPTASESAPSRSARSCSSA